MTTDLILGTAGHIDHGKTSLVRALTGVDTDRLPEEKQRGITIELGFAELMLGDFRLGIVDVPGHERFVRNMLAGATGVDVAMLVVAADDSIKPQTREHLEILRLLDLECGVIAVTKCDLVDPDWVELVDEEIRELVAGTFLESAPIVHTAATTGMGIDRLREELTSAASRAAASSRAGRIDGPFRMAIDRTFTMPGHGTVVTGSVSSGHVATGDELAIEPGGIQVRVRGLQNHDRTVDQVHRGQRAAINLAGVHHEQIRRGHELATAGHLAPSRLLTVRISLLPSAPRPLKQRARVRLHVGTAELLATLTRLDGDLVKPGESALAQLFLNEPAVTVWSQPLVIRSESPVVTIGGGRVLDPNAERLRKPGPEVLEQVASLGSGDPLRRASAALYFAGLRDWKPGDLSRTAGIVDPAAVSQQLREQGELLEIVVSPTRTIAVHQRWLSQLSDRVESALRRMHEENPLRSVVDRGQLAQGFRYLGDAALLDAVLKQMQQAKRVRLSPRGIALEGCGPKLSQNERKLLVQLIETYRGAGMHAPTVKECQRQATKNQQSVPQLISLAEADGDLVQVTAEYYLHTEVDRELQEKLREAFSDGQGVTLSQIREALNTTRKYAVPYCEYLDRIGFTRRDGDVRYIVTE